MAKRVALHDEKINFFSEPKRIESKSITIQYADDYRRHYSNEGSISVFFVCPHCGCEQYGTWKAEHFSADFYQWQRQKNAFKDLKARTSSISGEKVREINDFISNRICCDCGQSLSNEPGYLFVKYVNGLYLFKGPDLDNFSDINSVKYALPENYNKYFAKNNFREYYSIYDWNKITNEYVDKQVFEGKKYKSNNTFGEGSGCNVKPDSVTYVYFNGPEDEEERKIWEKEHKLQNISTRYFLGIPDVFDLMSYHRKHLSEDASSVKVSDMTETLYSTAALKTFDNGLASNEKNAEFYKNLFLNLINLETEIMSVSKRLPQIYYARDEYSKILFSENYTELKGKELLLENTNKSRKLLSEPYKRPYEVYLPSIMPKKIDEPSAPGKQPVFGLIKPTEPLYEKPGLFNKKKVSAQNAEAKAKYDEEVSEYNKAYTDYQEQLNQYESDVKAYNRAMDEYKEQVKLAEAEAKRQREAMVPEAQRKADEEYALALGKYEQEKNELDEKISRYTKEVEDLKEVQNTFVISNNPWAKEADDAEELLKSLIFAKYQIEHSGIIYGKYLDFVTYSTMYDYFASGRCSELEGPDGAYNLYESETRANIIITKLSDALDSLEDIKQNQYMLYTAVKEMNRNIERLNSTMSEAVSSLIDINDTMSDMSKDVSAIKENSRYIAYNTAATAYYSKVNANLTSALCFISAGK